MQTLQKKKLNFSELLKGDISTLITLILMVILFSSKSMAFHRSPSTSLLRRPNRAVM